MKQKLIVFILMLSLLVIPVYTSPSFISLKVDDKLISRELGQIDVIDGKTYMSVHFLEPIFKINMDFKNEDGQLELVKGDKKIKIDLNTNTLFADWLDVDRYVVISKKNDIMIPARIVVEYFDYDIKFDEKASTLLITSKLKEDKVVEEEAKDDKCVMYVTFDDGPSPYTMELLDLLKKYNMKATFFMLDAEMKQNQEVVKRMVEEGHGVGLHGVSHEKNTFYAGSTGPLKEMEQANNTLEEIVGFKTRLIRTPYGSSPYLTKNQYINLCSHDYCIWDWNIDSRDWAYRNPERTFYATTKMIKTTRHEPKVVLFHDIKNVVETMNLFFKWMDDNNYTSEAITADLPPVKMN